MMHERPRVIVVDDKTHKAHYLVEELRVAEPRWRISLFKNKSLALQEIRKQMEVRDPVAVVITDLDLNELGHSGFELIEEVQQIDPLAMTILYTAHRQQLKKYDTTGLGAFDVVLRGAKGDVVEQLLERTRTALRYRGWAVRNGYLRRYFDPKFWDAVDRDPSLLKPRTRDVTIAFWDIRGFSSLCDKLERDPDLVAGFLRAYCDLAARVIVESQGFLDKFVGDGVMALFAAFAQTEEGQKKGAIAAARAAQSMLAGFNPLVQLWTPKWEVKTTEQISIRLGCGIHTGRGLVGNLGTEFRDQFTAVGKDVNFAQRLEVEAAKEGAPDILVSQPTARHIEETISVKLYKTLNDVKNMRGDHLVYQVI